LPKSDELVQNVFPSLVANITAIPKNPSRCKYVSYSTR
jgi:hypothetical protein